MTRPQPSYLGLPSGELAARAAAAVARLEPCDLCGRRCRAHRHQPEAHSACRVGRLAVIHSHGPVDERESCLSRTGAINFSGCNMRCLYCDTAEFSCEITGAEVTAAQLAALMLDLQSQGCASLNLVSPSHVAAQILEALALAVPMGLSLPLIWNSGGYDSVETLALFDGVVDIYQPDIKYGDDRNARQCSGIFHYTETCRDGFTEMLRQVGHLQLDDTGLAIRGVLVRHLVLPDGLAGSAAALSWLPPGTALSLRTDYQPLGRAMQHPRLSKQADAADVEVARNAAQAAGLRVVG
jgi:putative pyruvate formate lyase activating enzyme